MWALLLRAIEVFLVAGGAFASIYAGKLWLEAQKHRSISEAKDESIKVAQNNADAWKGHYEASRLELNRYRDEVHAKNDENNDRILKLTEENAQLKSKTDLSPVLEFQKGQQAVNTRVVDALDKIVAHVESWADPTPKAKRPKAKQTRKRSSG